MIVLFVLGLLVEFRAQTADEIRSNRDRYLWGEGFATSLKRADDEALADLISQISVTVSSSFENEITEITLKTAGGSTSEFQESVRGIINTYSQSALTNTERIVISNEPNARVLRYIRRADVEKVFAERKNRVYDFVSVAEGHEEEARLADALRYYSWALALLRSHPDAKSIRNENADGTAYMHPYIIERINGILEDVRFSFLSKTDHPEHREIALHCTFRGKPVRNLEYSFWFGTDWSRLHTVKDGRTLIDFFGENARAWEQTNIKIEYAYADQLFGDRELEEVFRIMDPPYFSKAAREVHFYEREKPSTQRPEALPVQYELVKVDEAPFLDIVNKVAGAIRSGNPKEVRQHFTPEGFDVYEKLLHYGKARVVDDRGFEVFKNNRDYIARGTYMAFDFRGGNKTFVEEVVYHFNEDKKISTIAFGLGEIAAGDIYHHPAWAEEEKFVLVNFLEQYKTAFALKRLDYLETVFDDNAVIITGTVLKQKRALDGKPDPGLFSGNEIVQYNRFNKKEYLQRLKHVFASKEFINIEFEDNLLRKSNANPNVFGVQIKQNYRSSNYSDQGYLFLLIDFSDRKEPVIHVRTWQPQKDEDGRIYGLEDF